MSQDNGGKWSKLELPATTSTRSTQRRTFSESGDQRGGRAQKYEDTSDNKKNKWSDLEVPMASRKVDEPCETGKWSSLEVPAGRPERSTRSTIPLEPSKPNKWSDIPSDYVERQDRPRNPYNGLGPKPIQSYGSAMRTQDPQHIIGQQVAITAILRKNALTASIEQALITQKQEAVVKSTAIPIVTAKPKPTKKKHSALDDLDEDEDERKVRAAAALKLLKEQEGSEESEDEEEEDEDIPLTKAERKAAKQEAKKKRMIAAGLGHMYDRR